MNECPRKNKSFSYDFCCKTGTKLSAGRKEMKNRLLCSFCLTVALVFGNVSGQMKPRKFRYFPFFFPVLAAISVSWQPDKQSAMFAAEQQTTRVESLSKVIHQFPFQTSRVTTRNNTAKHTKRLISLPCRSRTAPPPPSAVH